VNGSGTKMRGVWGDSCTMLVGTAGVDECAAL
jgi:hypothetical protein